MSFHFQVNFSIFLFLVFSFFNLLQDRLDDLEKGIDGEAEEEAKVASDVRNEVIASVDLEVGVDLDVRGSLEDIKVFVVVCWNHLKMKYKVVPHIS